MISCKDCLHYDVCNWYASHSSSVRMSMCKDFKDRTIFQKLIPMNPTAVKRTYSNSKSNICRESGYYCEFIKISKEYKEFEYTDYKCPICGVLTKDGYPQYCWNCGQKFDWVKRMKSKEEAKSDKKQSNPCYTCDLIDFCDSDCAELEKFKLKEEK